jgi:hypothetical protein
MILGVHEKVPNPAKGERVIGILDVAQELLPFATCLSLFPLLHKNWTQQPIFPNAPSPRSLELCRMCGIPTPLL